MASLRIVFPWLSNGIAQRNTGTGVGMFPFEAQEVAVVETPSLRCFQHV